MFAKIALIGFVGFLVFLVDAANRGQLPGIFSFYQSLPFGDKLGHFLLMGTLSFLATWVSAQRFLSAGPLRIPLGMFVVFVVVSLEECSQILIRARNFSFLDLAADTAGIIVFGWLAARMRRKPCTG